MSSESVLNKLEWGLALKPHVCAKKPGEPKATANTSVAYNFADVPQPTTNYLAMRSCRHCGCRVHFPAAVDRSRTT